MIDLPVIEFEQNTRYRDDATTHDEILKINFTVNILVELRP